MKKLLLGIFILSSAFANAQFTETLSSDRPGQALSSSVVGKNVFQIQAGIDYFESASDFYPSSFFRFGLSERFELNSGIILSGNEFASDLESLTLGARYVLNSNPEANLKSSLQFSYDVGATNKSSQITYILGSSFSENLSYTINLGLNFNEDFALNNGIYIFNLSYALNEKVGVFLEPFGTFLKGDFQFNLDSGVYYLVNNNFQLDFLIGESNGFFTGAGITWRIPSKNN